ncbi:hypothetical protein [Candidatus Roseilinea sp. NK_OTU-006]|jgi:hypothetical protein|uniref:hypothetical protein n=1 Tax=Candidatus Roseilinea sp. NK_OTU-006 TaxID=2704250 RepID=UPI00145E2EB1|nr:hypothetical protein [Candidatus Roseilinea sp. NK_OTU-006]
MLFSTEALSRPTAAKTPSKPSMRDVLYENRVWFLVAGIAVLAGLIASLLG